MAYQPKSYKKFVATAATATLVATAVVPAAFANEAETAAFTDVPKSYEAAIDFVVSNNISKGLTETKYGIDAQIKRGDVAIIIANAAGLNNKDAQASGFKDVPTRGTLAVNSLKAAGIVDGKSTTNFGFADPITRGEAAIMLQRAFKITGNVNDVKFTDVSDRYDDAVAALLAHKVTKGVSTTKFGTDNPIKRGDFAKFIYALKEFVNPINPAAPVLNYEGSSTINVEYGGSYTLPNVTATDDVDKTVEVTRVIKNAAGTVVSSIDTKIPGTYTVTYSAVDSDGNKAKDLVVFVVVAEGFVPEVASVKTLNAKELQVTFNKAVKESTVIDSTDNTLVGSTFNFDGTDATGLKASLSENGKVLTISAATNFEGTHSFEVLANKVEDLAGGKVEQYATAFTFKDTTRASITGTEFVSKYAVKVNFSEPVTAASANELSAKLADGTPVNITSATPTADGKSTTVVFNSATPANKEITISFPALKDFAGTPNISVPSTAKFTVSDADQTKPSVSSVTATSNTTVKVKFSEVVTLTDASKILFNGSNTGVSAVIDSKDKTVLNVTVPSTTTSAVLLVDAGAVTDLSTNTNAAISQTVLFNADKVAPQVTGQNVIRESGVNKLVLTFSEDVKLDSSSDLTFTYSDTYGVVKTVSVPSSRVVVDSDDAKTVEINLTDVASLQDTNFTFDLPKGYFVDAFGNDSVARTVSFLNNANDTVSKLSLISSNPISTTDVDGNGTVADRANSGAFLDVQFADAVNAQSAKLAGNYTVEGAEVTEAELVYNNPTLATSNGAKAVVRLYIKDNTVEASGNYNVTVQGVKGYSSSVTTMDPKTTNLRIVENVRPTVTATAVKSFNTVESETVVSVTFSEAIANDTVANGDFELYVDGAATSTTITAGTLGSTIDFTIGTDLSDEIAAGKVVKLVPTSTLDLSDSNKNKADIKEIVIK